MNLIKLTAAIAVLLAGIFMALRLVHVIAWSWWLITSPLWGWCMLALAVGILLMAWIALQASEGRNPFE